MLRAILGLGAIALVIANPGSAAAIGGVLLAGQLANELKKGKKD